jgi:predicted O-methyltransferase YrrM
VDERLQKIAREAPGFMPEVEGLALYQAALSVGRRGPLLEVGTYCGKSTVYIGAAATEAESVVFTIDHHRGSEEHQPGEEYHDPTLTDAEGRIDTLPCFRKTMAAAGLEERVIALVGDSVTISAWWRTPLAFLFLDGGHSHERAMLDYTGYSRHLEPGGVLAIHDVFPNPADGGRPPFEVYHLALSQGFVEIADEGSLRLLRLSEL